MPARWAGRSCAGDLLAQVDQVVANTGIALAAIDAAPSQVVRTVIWVASSDRGDLSAAWARLCESEIGDAFTTASTLVGVACLGYAGQLVELDVTAAI